MPQNRSLLRIPGAQRTGAESRNPGRHVLQHGGPASAAQGRGNPAPCDGADSLGAPVGRSSAAGDADFADRGGAGSQLRARRKGRTPDVHQQELAVRRAGERRIRQDARGNRPGIPVQDLRRARGDSLRHLEIPDATQSRTARGRRCEAGRYGEGSAVAGAVPAGSQEVPDRYEGEGLRSQEGGRAQTRSAESRSQAGTRIYGQHGERTAAGPYH